MVTLSDGQYVLNHSQHLLMWLKTLRLREVDLVKVTLMVHPVQSAASFFFNTNPHITKVMLWKCLASVAETKKESHIYYQCFM